MEKFYKEIKGSEFYKRKEVGKWFIWVQNLVLLSNRKVILM